MRATRAGAMVAIALLLAFFAMRAPGFADPANLANIVQQSAVLGVLGCGMTIVVIAGGGDVVRGGIDLSIAANMGLCTAVYAVLARAQHGDVAALAAALLTGLGVGALNAFVILVLGVVPLLATLATMSICGGLELVLSHNTVVNADTGLLTALAGDGPAGLSGLAWVLVATFLLLSAILDHSPAGLRLRAVGERPDAARAAGLPVERFVACAYLASGACAAVAALLSAALLGGSSPGSNDSLLPAVLVALLGTVFSRRLMPSVAGTAASVLFVGALADAFQLLNLSSYWVSGVQGLLIVAVVAVTTQARRAHA